MFDLNDDGELVEVVGFINCPDCSKPVQVVYNELTQSWHGYCCGAFRNFGDAELDGAEHKNLECKEG